LKTQPAEHGPYASPGFWLHHAALTWRQECERRLGSVTYPQFNVISAISLLGDGAVPPTQQAVADFARFDRQMTSKIVQSLEERGLVRRRRDANDGRLLRLELTAEGRAAVRKCVRAARAADEAVFGAGELRRRLRDDLRTIAERRQHGPTEVGP
jgi:DNA-binding MarR family transcriptional regulator